MNQEGSITINDILDLAKTYLHEEKNIHLIEKAFLIAKEKHDGQMRKSGEPYVQHPLEVAYILPKIQKAILS